MPDELKNRAGTPETNFSVAEIARLTVALEQERLKSQRYRLAAESATNLIYEWDLGSRVEWFGQVDELLGYQPNEIPRTWEGFTSLLNSEDRERVLAAVEKQLKAGEPYFVECRVRRKDGTYLYWQDRGTVVRDESGKPVKWLGAVSDITDRKRAELALKNLSARQETLLVATPDIIMEVDNNRVYIWANQEGLRFFGEDVIGEEAASFFEGEQKTYQIVQPVFAGNEDVIYVESWQRRRDGQKRLLAWKCRTLKDEYGNVKGALSTATDITERMQAEEQIAKHEAELSGALQMAHAGNWEYDVDQDIFTFNDNFYRIFRTTAAEVGGYQMSSAEYARRFCHPDDAAAVGKETRAAIESADPNYSRQIEHRILYADGEVGTITVRFLVVKDAHGRTVKTYGVNQDITERKRAEEKLKESEAGLAEAQRIAHIGNWERDFVTGELHWSDEIYRIFGLEVSGSGISFEIFLNAIHPDDRECLLKSRKEAFSSDKPYDFDHRIVLSSGEIRVVHEQGAAQFDKSGTAIRMAGTVQDITDRKKAEERTLETLRNLRKAYGGIVKVLSAASEVRDPYTAGHQKRVADLARSIAQEMGLAPECVEGLRLAGSIHDIGKLSVPVEILSKPTRLTKLEFSLIQSHAQRGYDILKDIDFAWPIARIVHQHHERMDGSGYPQQLKGDDILLESRILAVSDVIEAMASHRPYRPALGIEAAIQEIEKGKGVIYDPAVVAACLALFREKGYVLKD